jgi:hypothetical protein
MFKVVKRNINQLRLLINYLRIRRLNRKLRKARGEDPDDEDNKKLEEIGLVEEELDLQAPQTGIDVDVKNLKQGDVIASFAVGSLAGMVPKTRSSSQNSIKKSIRDL